MLIDLQLHSKYSDGYLSPTEVAKFIAEQGVKAAALTDHNTVGGIDEFRHACRKWKIKPINGLELYVKLHRYRFNLLWYNFNEDDPDLHNMLRRSHARRRRSMRILLDKLAAHGFKININQILDKYNRYVPANHVADDIMAVRANINLVKRELKIDNPREGDFLMEYFYNKNIGKLKNAHIDMDDIIVLREKIGGQLVL
ncbi:MAG: PHP domain-containing protein, partial [Patescibacteria group bacterium]|nr:PHP domain-containing protein [Patescibacteria group bacterium]